MKALILERRGPYAAALREDGTVVKIRRAGQVGETVELDADLVSFTGAGWGRQLLRTAAAAALAVAVLGGAYGYTAVWACSYVSLETEEVSVELSLNRLGRVVGVTALNESSEELADTLNSDLKNAAAEEALSAAVTELRRSAGDAAMVAGVTDGSGKRAAALTETVTRAAGAGGELYTVELTPAERRDAAGHNQSPGHYGMRLRGEELPESGEGPDMAATVPAASPRPAAAHAPTEAPAEQSPAVTDSLSVPAASLVPETSSLEPPEARANWDAPDEPDNHGSRDGWFERDDPDGPYDRGVFEDRDGRDVPDAPDDWGGPENPAGRDGAAPQEAPAIWNEFREREEAEDRNGREEAGNRDARGGRDAWNDRDARDDRGDGDDFPEREAPEDQDAPRELEAPGDWDVPPEREAPESGSGIPTSTAPESREGPDRAGQAAGTRPDLFPEGGRRP